MLYRWTTPPTGSRTSGALATGTAGSLSAADDRPVEADPIAPRRRGHKTPDNRDVSPYVARSSALRAVSRIRNYFR